MSSIKKLNKVAVIGLDIEDWYHLDYIPIYQKKNYLSMLDGFDKIIEILIKLNCTASLFIVGEIISKIKEKILFCSKQGFEIASHGYTHKRPMTMTINDFKKEIKKTKSELEKVLKKKIYGYRAPCFSLDRDRLDILFNEGYSYDSSKIEFKSHKLYGDIDLDGFKRIYNNIYVNKKNKYEFELPTFKFLNKKIPFSGGGYLRLFSENIIKNIIKQKEKINEPIFFYLHPFEFSRQNIKLAKIGFKNYLRMNIGRKKMPEKFENILKFMINRGWKFTTFKKLQNEI